MAAHMHWSHHVQRLAAFLPHLSSSLPFAPLIFHLSLILCLFYISIHRLFLLILTVEWARRARAEKRGSCPLWVAKRLPFERSNPLHHISPNLLCFPVTLWECVSASNARLAAPLLFSPSLLIPLYLLHLWLLLLSLIPPTSKPFNSCLLLSVCVVIILCVYRWHGEILCKLQSGTGNWRGVGWVKAFSCF